jgi:hypothetical protein
MKNKLGRPLEPPELWDGWQTQIIDLYKVGAGDNEIKALIFINRGSFSNGLWERWVKEEPEFSETIKAGKLLSAAWWEKKGRSKLEVKEFNYVGWYMNMKNRFGWKDKTETELSGGIKVEQSEVDWGGKKIKV